MVQEEIPEELPTHFAPEIYPSFFHTEAGKVKNIFIIKTATITINPRGRD